MTARPLRRDSRKPRFFGSVARCTATEAKDAETLCVRMTEPQPEGAKKRGWVTELPKPFPPPVPVAVARPRAVEAAARRMSPRPTPPPRTNSPISVECEEQDDCTDDAVSVESETVRSDENIQTFLLIGDYSRDHVRRLSPSSVGEDGRSAAPEPANDDGTKPPAASRRARVDVSPAERSALLNYMRASSGVGDEIIWTCNRCGRPMNERKGDGSVNTTNMLNHVRRCYEVQALEERSVSAESEKKIAASEAATAAASSSSRTFRAIGDGLADSSHRLSPSSDEDQCSEQSNTSTEKREGQHKHSERADLSARERSVLSNYLHSSGEGEAAVWTCKKCNRDMYERKNNGMGSNTNNVFLHIRRCYCLEEGSFEDLCAQDPPPGDCHDTTTASSVATGRSSTPPSSAPAASSASRTFRVIGDGLPDSFHRLSPSSDEDQGSEQSITSTEKREGQHKHSERADLSPRERSVLSNYLHSSGAGEAAVWTCKKCNRKMSELRNNTRINNTTNVFLHIRRCYCLEEGSFEDLCAQDPPPGDCHDTTAASSVATARSTQPSSSRPSTPMLQQESRIVQQFMEPIEGGALSAWRCRKCGGSLKPGMKNEGGREFSATGYSALVRHLKGCVGASVIREFLATESEGACSGHQSRKESFASDSSLTESSADDAAAGREGSAPCWSTDVVLNAPEAPHAGYQTLVDAVASFAAAHDGDYLLFESVSNVMNAALPQHARYMMKEDDGTFRLASPFELRGKVLEIFSNCAQNRTAGEDHSDARSVPREVVTRGVAGEGSVPREVSLSLALSSAVPGRPEGSSKRKRDGPLPPVDRSPLVDVEYQRRAGSAGPRSPPDANAGPLKKLTPILDGDEPMNGEGSNFLLYV